MTKQARVFFISICADCVLDDDCFWGAVVTRAADNDAAMRRLEALNLVPPEPYETIVIDITDIYANEHPFDKRLSKEDLKAAGPVVKTGLDKLRADGIRVVDMTERGKDGKS